MSTFFPSGFEVRPYMYKFMYTQFERFQACRSW
eukprot:SAG22_NODE_3760_length_1540_cov_1.234559_1_plen_32_part_10